MKFMIKKRVDSASSTSYVTRGDLSMFHYKEKMKEEDRQPEFRGMRCNLELEGENQTEVGKNPLKIPSQHEKWLLV